jgi:hypothetical protein
MAYTPVSTMFSTPYSSTTVLSPYTPLTISPAPLVPPISTVSTMSTVSQSVIVNNDPLTVVTPIGPVLYNVPSRYIVDVDTGMNDNYIVQRDVTLSIMYKTLDKWIYEDFPNVLKYLVVDKDGKVRPVKSESEKDNNKVSNDSERDLEKKSDYIGDNILTERTVREILMRIMRELGLRWYELPHREQLLKDVIEKYIKKKLKKHLE